MADSRFEPCLYVFGADGMLGRALVAETRYRDRRPKAVPVGREVDITNAEAVGLALSGMTHYDVVVNAAAMTNMEACERDYDKAFAVNALGAANISAQARGTYVHISTGAVFDGLEPAQHDLGGYDEFTTPRPISAYARTKYAGEELVKRDDRTLIVRLGHLYGPGGRNGLSTARAKFLAGEPVSINETCKITPTYVGDAARLILNLALNQKRRGFVVHVAPEGATTAFQFASRLRDVLPGPCTGKAQVLGTAIVYPNRHGALGAIYGMDPRHALALGSPPIAENVAWRPEFQRIRSRTLRHYGIEPLGPWEEGLDRYLKTPASS